MKSKLLIGLIAGLMMVSAVSAVPWHNTEQSVTLTAEDIGDVTSGVDNIFYCKDQDDNCDPRSQGQQYDMSGDGFIVSREGINFVRYNAEDKVGNIEPTHSRKIKIDYTNPGTTDDYPGGWQNTSIKVNLTCNDPENPSASGCSSTEYCVVSAGSTCTPSTEGNSITFSSEGRYNLRYRSTDVAGNTESTHSTTVKLDFTDPVVQVRKGTEGATVSSRNATAFCEDGLSGCNEDSLRIYASETAAFECPTQVTRYNEDSPFSVNQHLWVCAAGKDKAGNWDNNPTPVEFNVGTLIVEMTYPGQPGAVITSTGSTIPVLVKVGNEQEDKTRTINVTVEGVNSQISGSGQSKQVTLDGVESQQFNIISKPENPGNATLTVKITDETKDFTVTKDIEMEILDRGSRTSTTGKQVPGIGLLQVAALMLAATGYYMISIRP